MGTLKPFIKTAVAVLFALLLGACASMDDPASSAAVEKIGHHATDGETVAGPTVAIPEIKGENASDFAEAVALIREQRYADAEIVLLGITADQPELAGPWINLGQVYVAQNQSEDARLAFEAAVTANPLNCTAHNELGLLSRRDGDFESAEQHYLRCLEQVPGHGPTYLNLGILYELYLGRLTEALASYQHYQALQVEPDRKVRGWVMDLERRLGV